MGCRVFRRVLVVTRGGGDDDLGRLVFCWEWVSRFALSVAAVCCAAMLLLLFVHPLRPACLVTILMSAFVLSVRTYPIHFSPSALALCDHRCG